MRKLEDVLKRMIDASQREDKINSEVKLRAAELDHALRTEDPEQIEALRIPMQETLDRYLDHKLSLLHQLKEAQNANSPKK